MSEKSPKTVPIAAVVAVLVVAVLVVAVLVVAVAAAYAYVAHSQPHPVSPSDELTSYGRITSLDYQGTTVSMLFTADTTISLYSAGISYDANNHASSSQSYQRGQMPIGAQPVYKLQNSEDVNMTFTDFPAGSLLLNMVVQVNVTVGSQTLLLNYDIPQLETNSTQ